MYAEKTIEKTPIKFWSWQNFIVLILILNNNRLLKLYRRFLSKSIHSKSLFYFNAIQIETKFKTKI